MLGIRKVSGEELTIALEEDLLPDLRALKRRLNQVHGFPPRFRQRLLLHGKCLEDTATLQAGMELELVLLVFVPNPSPDEVHEFTAAARVGGFDKVRALGHVKFRSPLVPDHAAFRPYVWKLKFPAVFPDFRLSPC